MSNRLEGGDVWTALDPAEPVLEPVNPCPTGFENHTWRFTIEEGQATFTPIEDCNGECHWWEPEAIGYLDLGVVRLRVENEHGDGTPLGGWHGLTRCECSYWVEPIAVAPGDWPRRQTEHEALEAIVEGVRALRRCGGTATEMFAALDHYDEVMGK